MFGQAVTNSAAPGDEVAWTLLAATYARLERETDAANCAFQARRLTATAMANLMGASPRKRLNDTDASELAELVGPAAHVKTALLCLDMHIPSVARSALDLGVFDPDAENAGLRDDERLVHKLCLARAAFLEAKSVTDETSRVKITREDDDDDDDDERDGFVANDESSSERDARFDVAFGFIADALGIDATDPRPFELLGDAHAHERRFSEAEEAYTHAMACSGQRGKPPASLKLFLNLGGCLLKNGKFADARGVFAAACEIGRARRRGSASARRCCARATRRARRRRWRRRTCWTPPTPTRGRTSRSSRWSPSRRGSTKPSARRAGAKRAADDAETLAELADRFMRVGGWKHAEAAARRAVKHGAGVETRLCLARASRERGDAEGAAAELKYAPRRRRPRRRRRRRRRRRDRRRRGGRAVPGARAAGRARERVRRVGGRAARGGVPPGPQGAREGAVV